MANNGAPAPERRVEKTESEWKAILNSEQFRITRQKGTEAAGTGEFCYAHDAGKYSCICCDTELFDSSIKFESGTGWPSFTEPVQENAIKYERENLNLRKDKLSQQEEIADQQQQIILITAISLALIFIGVFWYFRQKIVMTRKKVALEKAKAIAEKKAADLKNEALRSHISTHFIFNTLDQAKVLIANGDTNESLSFIGEICKHIRITLENAVESKVNLEDELSCLDSYMKLSQKMKNDTFTYTFEVDPEINVEESQIPPMLIQPFLENSVIHSGAGDGQIKLILKHKSEHEIECRVVNSVNGTKTINAAYKKKSLGMALTKDRLALNNENLGVSKDIIMNQNDQEAEVVFSMYTT